MKRSLCFALAFGLLVPARAEKVVPPSDAGIPAGRPVNPPLTLKRAFELAALRSERLEIRAEEIEQSRSRYKQTRGAVLPDLRFRLDHRIQDKPPASTDGDGNSADRASERTESRFMLRQPIFQGFREFHALSSLRADENKQRLLFQREATLLYQDVADAFFFVIQLETELADLQALMKLSNDRIGELRERADLGKSRGSEVVTAESQYANYRAQEANLRGGIAAARERLSFLIAEPLGATPLVDSFADPAQAPALDELVTRSHDRSDVAALREEVLARRAGVKVANAGHWPSLVATGNYYVERPDGFQKEIDWDALFTFDIPIYQGGTIRALALEARSLLRQAERDHARLIRLTESDVRTIHALLASSIEETRLLEDAAKKAKRAYELLTREYRMGLINNLDVLQAMNTYQTVKRDYDLSRLQAKLNLLNLRLAVEMAPEELP